MCDAMSPEFKAANDILIRIIKANDRTDGVPYPRLVELNKAFKANDVKAAKAAYDKLVAFIPKGEKTLHDELKESQEKLAETTKQIETSKKALAQEKAIAGMFDKFTKAIDTAKANPKMLPKLNAYAEKLKQYGDFSKRIAQAVQMDKAGKDVAKQCDMLKKAVADGKAKHAKAYKLTESEFAKAKNRLAVYKEAVKIRTAKIADFVKEKEDIKKLGGELPDVEQDAPEDKEALKKKLIDYLTSLGNIGIKAKREFNEQDADLEKHHFGFGWKDKYRELLYNATEKIREVIKSWPYERASNLIKDLGAMRLIGDPDEALTWFQKASDNNKELKPFLRYVINFLQRRKQAFEMAENKLYGGTLSYWDVRDWFGAYGSRGVPKDPIRASFHMLHNPESKNKVKQLLKQIGIDNDADVRFFISRLRDGYLAFQGAPTMKKHTLAFILDSMVCDAMLPEFKAANDVLLRIIKLNDRTDGVPFARLSDLGKAFKANDAKAAKQAYDRIIPLLSKGEKMLQDELKEAKLKLAEVTKQVTASKATLAQSKQTQALFDKFAKAVDGVKTNPKGVSRLGAYADKLKAYGDFSRRISALAQMANQKKDIVKQCDILKKAIEAGKVKFAKEQAKLAKGNAAILNRLQVYKEMDKIRTKKIAEFQQESNDIAKLGGLLPKEQAKEATEKPQSETTEQKKTRALKYINSTIEPAYKSLRAEEDAYITGLLNAVQKAETEKRNAGKSASDVIRSCAEEMPINPVARKLFVVARDVQDGIVIDSIRALFNKASAEAKALGKDTHDWEKIKSIVIRAADALRNLVAQADSATTTQAPYEKKQMLTYVGSGFSADELRHYERDTLEKLFGAKRQNLREMVKKVAEILPIKVPERRINAVSAIQLGKSIVEYLRKEVEQYKDKADV